MNRPKFEQGTARRRLEESRLEFPSLSQRLGITGWTNLGLRPSHGILCSERHVANQRCCITSRNFVLPRHNRTFPTFSRFRASSSSFSFLFMGLSPRCLPSGMMLTCSARLHWFGILSRSQRSMRSLRGIHPVVNRPVLSFHERKGFHIRVTKFL
jgi:hypothetical protein